MKYRWYVLRFPSIKKGRKTYSLDLGPIGPLGDIMGYISA
jgi:hypothetical protein